MTRRRLFVRLWLLALLLAVLGSAAGMALAGYRHAVNRLAADADEQLQVRALALRRLIDRYRVLPTVLALDPDLRRALSDGAGAPDVAALNRKLEQANGATHVSTLTLIDRRGKAIAASNWREPSSNVGLDYAFRPYFQLAMREDRGSFYGIGISTNLAGYFIAEALHDDAGRRIGVIVVKISLDTLEQEWARGDLVLLLADRYGIVFLSNRPAWMFRALRPLDAAAERTLQATRQYDGRTIQPAAWRMRRARDERGGLIDVRAPAPAGEMVWRSMPLNGLGWTLHALHDTREAALAAWRAAWLTLCAWLPLLLLGVFLQQRLRLARLRQRSREELERLVAHYADALRSDADSLVTAAERAGEGSSAVLERLPQGISVIDAELRLVAWNRRYAEIFDYPPELLQAGRPIEDLLRHNARRGLLGRDNVEEAIQRRLDYLRRGAPHMYEREHADGTVLEIRGRPLPDGGFVTSYADITAYKHAARELRTLASTLESRIEQSTRGLREAKVQAERINREKTRYVAAAVHDLLQPLNAARLYAGSLRQALPETERLRLLDHVEMALRGLDSQLDSMMDLSRLDAGVLEPRREAFALSPLLRELVQQFGIVARSRGLALRFVDTRARVVSDPALLRRVLQNFLSNAMHYTVSGRVLLGVRRHGGALRIEVWDTGAGIPEDQHAAIFQEFRRLDAVATDNDRGTGLGLSIVQRIARLLGHAVTLRSTVGRGSVFAVEVPLAADGEATSPGGGRTTRVRSAPRRAIHAAGLDDETLALLERLAGPLGVSVRHVAAWPALRALPRADVLVLDEATTADPEAAWRELSGAWSGEVPCIVLTARAAPVAEADALAASLHWMGKPATAGRLRAIISRLLAAAH